MSCLSPFQHFPVKLKLQVAVNLLNQLYLVLATFSSSAFNTVRKFNSKGIIFIRTFLLVSIKSFCLKVFLVYSLFVV